MHQQEFAAGIQQLSLKDDNQYPDDLMQVKWFQWPVGDLSYSDLALRASDATVGDLW